MKKHATSGFTLVELMVVLAIAAVLAGVIAPNVAQFTRNYRLTSAANDLLSAIYVARSEAIKRQVSTVLCFTTDANPASGQPDCSGNGTQGWVTWVDTDDNAQIGASEQILTRHAALSTTLSVVTKPASSSKFVAYRANGFTRTITDSLSGVVICDSRNNTVLTGMTSAARGLIISPTGRPGITRSVTEIATSTSLLSSASTGTCVP